MNSSRSARTGRAAAALATVLVLAGCGIRVGHPPAPVPSPDSAETARQDVAVALERVVLVADATTGGTPEARERLTVVLEGYLEDLGGVWLPPPREEDPQPSSPALESLPETLAQAAEVSAGDLADALPQTPQMQREALVSMWLTLRTAQAAFGGEEATDCTLPCGETMIPPISSVPESVELAASYDALAYVQEIHAARAGVDTRDDAAAGARALRAFAEELTGAHSGTDSDPRRAAYPVDPEDLGASARSYLERALVGWLVLAAESGKAEALEAVWHTSRLINPGHEIGPWPGLTSP